MMDYSIITGKLDETLDGLEQAVNAREKEKIDLTIETFNKLISAHPESLEEIDFKNYRERFKLLTQRRDILPIMASALADLRNAERDEVVEGYSHKVNHLLRKHRWVLGDKMTRHYVSDFGRILKGDGYIPK